MGQRQAVYIAEMTLFSLNWLPKGPDFYTAAENLVEPTSLHPSHHQPSALTQAFQEGPGTSVLTTAHGRKDLEEVCQRQPTWDRPEQKPHFPGLGEERRAF